MSIQHPFDDVAKCLGSNLSRRSVLARATKGIAIVFGATIGLARFTRRAFAEVIPDNNLRSRINDPNWTCQSVNAVRLGGVEEEGKEVYPSLCIYDVLCRGEGKREEFITAGRLEEGKCLEFREYLRREKEQKKIAYAKAELGKQPENSANVKRFGSQCRYRWGRPMVYYRQHPEKELWNTVCASPVENCMMPDAIKGSFLVVCPTTGEVKIEGKFRQVCPPVHDCLANFIPVVVNPPMVQKAGN